MDDQWANDSMIAGRRGVSADEGWYLTSIELEVAVADVYHDSLLSLPTWQNEYLFYHPANLVDVCCCLLTVLGCSLD